MAIYVTRDYRTSLSNVLEVLPRISLDYGHDKNYGGTRY
jgi:hypothetical protein